MRDCFRSSTEVRSGEQISLPDVNGMHCGVCKYSFMSDRGLPPAGPRPWRYPGRRYRSLIRVCGEPATSAPPTLGRTHEIVNACVIVFGPLHGASQGGGKHGCYGLPNEGWARRLRLLDRAAARRWVASIHYLAAVLSGR